MTCVPGKIKQTQPSNYHTIRFPPSKLLITPEVHPDIDRLSGYSDWWGKRRTQTLLMDAVDGHGASLRTWIGMQGSGRRGMTYMEEDWVDLEGLPTTSRSRSGHGSIDYRDTLVETWRQACALHKEMVLASHPNFCVAQWSSEQTKESQLRCSS
jgi:hypothetical protein